jgi:hypothetical protein
LVTTLKDCLRNRNSKLFLYIGHSKYDTMKSILSSFGFLISLGVTAQEESSVCKVSDEDFDCRSKSVTFNKDSKTLTLNEDAYYKDGIIDIKGADQIIFDQANKEIVATGNFNFTIDGAIQVTTSNAPPQKLKYKIGDTVAYIE